MLLSDLEESKILPIVVGSFEAQGIISALKGQEYQRPMTYDLIKTLCETLDGEIVEIFINDVKDDIFYARIHMLDHNDEFVEIDARPSDAIALALRFDAPIFINFQLIEFTCDYEDLIDEQK
ncbi:bifunctional nuclease family protein [Natranaerobius trueperi]|uniref:bifunctional nuclease family protein n=1 Tax=Natranaerobius trueperi TaxID=759412 RepID=UPI001F0B0068|nr:bifunctional nuclease family protein [Natranaerobius trueperi]